MWIFLTADMGQSLEQFRKQVIRSSLFPETSLGKALARMGFVRADPIRCPARAQDLILRQRVKHYKSGDLERQYPRLELEEVFAGAHVDNIGSTLQNGSAMPLQSMEFVQRRRSARV